MLSDMIERVNRLRIQAQDNPEFAQSAAEHAQALNKPPALTIHKRKAQYKRKTLAACYQPYTELTH